MENFLAMLQVQLTLFVYLAVGFFIRKRGFITDAMRSGLTNLLIYLLLPCMIFNSFHLDVTFSQLLSAATMLGSAVGLAVFAWLMGYVLFRRFPNGQEMILRYGALVANSSFAGLPVIQSAYGTEGLFYAAVFIIPNRIFMWSAGISLFTEKEKGGWVRNILLNPGIIAVFLGLARMLLRIPLPGFVNTAVANIGNCTTSMSIIIVGSILADVDLRSIFSKGTLYMSFIRLIFLPVVALLVLKAIHFGSLTTAVSVVLTGMPVGSTAAILAEKYGADAGFASKCVFVTTVLSLITIPVLSIFL